MRVAATLLALVVALTAAAVTAAPAALAACLSGQPAGAPLPTGGGQDPLITRLGLRRVWELSTGAGVRVAVVDSGVDDTHPKLAGAVVPTIDFQAALSGTQAFTAGPGPAEDCENHGTPIAGLIAARPAGDDRVVGVAPEATIVPMRFESDIANAPDEMIAAAIRTGADRADVVNLSFAVAQDRPPIRDAVRYALDRGVVVVAAAGNENASSPGRTWWPAAYPGVLAVASVDDDGQPSQESNRGPWVGVAAPGKGLTAISSGGGYVGVTGTSFATGIVSGVAALVRARFRGLPAAEVVRRIEATAVSPTGGRDEITGYGIVDPFAALTAVDVDAPATALSEARGAGIRVLPLPGEQPTLTAAGAVAAGAAGVLVALAAAVGLAGVARRRAAARRGDPVAARRFADVHAPLRPVPEERLDGG